MVKYNGKEITKEELKAIVKRNAQMKMEIKRLSKTEFGRELLKRKGIKPIE